MNQQSIIPFGTNAAQFSGYAQATGERLGAFDLVIENVGDATLTVSLKEFNGTTAPSGWVNLAGQTAFTVAARGKVTRSIRSMNKRIGFFGSGNTVANISTVVSNPGDLRGAQIDIVAVGRRGWGYDQGFPSDQTRAGWGAAPDSSADRALGE
jgi:hypothetical protein